MQDDLRPAFILNDVKGVDFRHVKAGHASGVATVVLKDVEEFSAHDSRPVPDTQVLSAATKEF